ncbi:outer membrane lipoprotein carrier protein LolA [Kangiella aquimarina]|uniref:Outer membrane lipoprotein carrier protein LolA n=1 Tax=Kangiella aquimarina TaxID=261965 RepID=A0ABZ0X523_9GAMM|nr:outer membrane lipoprotein carrier protein LolA [Kangiella aquimarina]WQG85688.1 outer membrane lipoprotein carrier protein LolA [Kangiella aquimarina]
MPLFNFLLASILYGLLFVTSSPVKAEQPFKCSLESIASELGEQAMLNEFVQTKQVTILKKPLISKGYLLISDDNQVIWQTQQPIKSTLLIGQQTLRQFNKNDQPVMSPANNNQKMSQLISSTFLAILAGDFEKLDNHFSVALDCTETRWSIELEASSNDMKPIITNINISGQNHIETLSFTEASGDSTQLVLSPSTDPDLINQLRSYVIH